MHKQFAFILFLTSFLTSPAHAQTADQVKRKITELHAKGIDTIVQVRPYCDAVSNSVQRTDSGCFSDNIAYLLWQHKGANYILLIDDCHMYKPDTGRFDAFFAIISKHFNTIAKEKIKPPAFKQKSRPKLLVEETLETTVNIDNSCYTEFVFNVGTKKVIKTINNYYLDKDYLTSRNVNPNESVNANEEYNNRTYLKQLKDIFEQQTQFMQPARAD